MTFSAILSPSPRSMSECFIIIIKLYEHMLVDLPRCMKASFVCEHDLFQVIFIILYATEHFQGKRLAVGSVIGLSSYRICTL